jgi:23S rRNA (uracil1939-C5)-methyltransferase
MTTQSQPIRPTPLTPEPVPARRQRRERRRHDRPLEPIELTLDGFAHGGRAVGHADDGRVVFVEYALPGERVIAEITNDQPRFIEATAVLVLEASPQRVEARCQYFGRCGGCQLQHINYDEQLRLKRDIVAQQLERIGRFAADEVDTLVQPMIGMREPWGYRNHMRFTVRRDGQVGFMQRGTHRFLRIDKCLIASDAANAVLDTAQDSTMQMHQLAIRTGSQTGDMMIQPRMRWRPMHRGQRPPSGQRSYRESLLGQTYRISGPAFFQVNSAQAERLLELVIERVQAVSPRVVVDAYAGVGTIAAQLAPLVNTVVTIEESTAAGDDASINLAEFENVQRIVAKVEDALPGLDPAPEVVVIDPPRSGIDAVVVQAIIDSVARRVVYVSCDPGTLARDLRRFADGGFAVSEVQPLDMFPHTQHIECITTLDRADLTA